MVSYLVHFCVVVSFRNLPLVATLDTTNRHSIPNRVTQLVLKTAIGTVRFLHMLGKGLRAIGTFVVAKPSRIMGRILLRTILPMYRLMFNAKHRAIPNAIRGKERPTLLSLFTGKYLFHAAIVILTVGATIGNVSARGTGMEDITSGSILSAFSIDENTEDVVERAPTKKVSYMARDRAISPEVSFEAELGADPGAEASIADTGNALQIPTVGDNVVQRSDVTTYVVQNGDTIGGIANRFAVTQKTILAANSTANADFIKPGQELLIPPITGVLHKVVKGDTIASIAKKYKVDEQDVLDFNHLADASAISTDQTIMVPGGELPEPVPTPSAPGRQPSYGGAAPGSAPAIGGGKLNWPTVGHKINQYFRYGHTGIDAECRYSDPLYAAREGTVTAVVYQRYGYGYHVMISHGGGLITLYGHASKIFVKPGQRVSRGQSIAMCGSTGRSSGTHVHFETIVNGRKVNPLSYL